MNSNGFSRVTAPKPVYCSCCADGKGEPIGYVQGGQLVIDKRVHGIHHTLVLRVAVDKTAR